MSLEKATIFKIKDAATAFADFIRTVDARNRQLPPLEPITLPEDLEFDGQIEIAAAFKNQPAVRKTQNDIPWLAFLNEGKDPEDRYTFVSNNRYPCAVVAIKIIQLRRSHFYALTFGLGGESFLKPEAVVRDFGIRVAMNICDKDRLKRVQTSIHEAISTQSEKQISVGSNFSVFNIDDEKEFRQLSG